MSHPFFLYHSSARFVWYYLFGCLFLYSGKSITQPVEASQSLSAIEAVATDTFTFADFPIKQELTAKALPVAVPADAQNLCLLEDRYLLFDGFEGNKNAHLYDLETGNLFHFGTEGTGPGELLNFGHVDYREVDRTIWIHDVPRQLWVGYSLPRLLESEGKEGFLRQITFELPGTVRPRWVDTTTYMHLVLNDGRGRVFFSDKDGKLLSYAGAVPEPPKKKGSLSLQAEAYQGHLYRHPEQNLFLYAAVYSDLMEGYDRNGSRLFGLSGPASFRPVGSVLDYGDESHFAVVPATRIGSPRLAFTEEAFFALYSGRSETSAPDTVSSPGYWKHKSQDLLGFSLEGAPLVHVQLDREIQNFALSRSIPTILYGLSSQTGEALTFVLPGLLIPGK